MDLKFLFCFLLLSNASIVFAGLQAPKQFESSNAAVILGLEDAENLTEKKIKDAARKLIKKYYPDRYESQSDKDLATEITKKIILARVALQVHLEQNPDFRPKNSAGPDYTTRPDSHGGNSNQDFSWEQAYAASSSQVVPEDYYGTEEKSSLRGTLFEFLYQSPGFREAYLLLEGVTITKDASLVGTTDLLLKIRPEIFPRIEVKVLSQRRNGLAPQLINSFFVQYKRGFRQGGAGDLFDGIVFPNGNYLFLAIASKVTRQFVVKPIDDSGTRVMISAAPKVLLYFADMKEGDSTGYGFNVSGREHHEILPAKKPQLVPPVLSLPKWKEVTIDKANGPIPLGYNPTPAVSADKKVGNNHKADVTGGRVSETAGIYILKYGVRFDSRLPNANEIFSSALSLSLSVAPGSFLAFPANDENLDFLIDVTTADKISGEMKYFETKGADMDKVDAYSFLGTHPDGNRKMIIVRLLWDKLAYSKSQGGKFIERPDAFLRIAAALSHEIYGNVRSLSDIQRGHLKVSSPSEFRYIDQVFLEVRAYEQGAKAIERMAEIVRSIPELGEKLKQDVDRALKVEKTRLSDWRAIHLSLLNEEELKTAKQKPKSVSAKSCFELK